MHVLSSHIIAEYKSTAIGCQSCPWSAEQGNFSLPPFAPENLVFTRQVWLYRLVLACSFSIQTLNLVLTQSGTRDAPPCGFLPLSLFDLIAIPLSLLLHFIPLSLSLLCPPIWAVLHHLYMYMVAFLALRILYVIALVCFVFVPCSPPESLPGKDVLSRLLPRPLPSVCFLFFSFLFRPCSPPICFGETSSIL